MLKHLESQIVKKQVAFKVTQCSMENFKYSIVQTAGSNFLLKILFSFAKNL